MNRWQHMGERVQAYLNARRRLGYQLRIEGEELQRFADFAGRRGHHGPLTLKLALAWAEATPASQLYRARRLEVLRGLAKYCVLYEPETVIPAPGLLGPSHRRLPPHIYTDDELDKLLAAASELGPSQGLRGPTIHCLLGLLAATGARVSELIAIRASDLESKHCTAVHLHGKGRKERVVPLWKRTQEIMKTWLASLGAGPEQILFPNRFGKAMTRSGVEKRLACAVRSAAEQCPTLNQTRVSPHVLRHTTAMHLLQSGVDLAVIALWLGHESVTTTHQYLEASLQMKQQALDQAQEPDIVASYTPPTEDVLSFLDRL